MSFKLTQEQTHSIAIIVLAVVAVILVVLVVKAVKKEKFRYRAVGVTGGGLAARLRNRSVGGQSALAAKKKNRIQVREGFNTVTESRGGTFMLDYSRENFASGKVGEGATGLKAEGISPLVDAKSLKSHLRTKQRIIY
jgi:hypothetical protein